MEMDVTVKSIFLLELRSKQDWVNKIPGHLPEKAYPGEKFLFVDKNGYIFNSGADFEVAEKQGTYPCRVYRLVPVSLKNKL